MFTLTVVHCDLLMRRCRVY